MLLLCFMIQTCQEQLILPVRKSPCQIKEKNWYGPDGMENVRTTKEPKQAIPTFAETVSLLMKPENLHVKFNIDVKVQNDPARTFPLMHKAISAHPDWETTLAPRLVLGLWHPMFLPYAKEFLPYCRRSYIGINPSVAKKYFWDDCDTFSIAFPVLATYEGERFRMECKEAGKTLMVWTVNKPEQMMEAVRWGVDCILTDVTQTWLELRSALKADYDKIDTQYGRTFLWTSVLYYSPTIYTFQYLSNWRLAKLGGPFDRKVVVAPAESKAVAGVA
ncbi:hypothetical protein D9758_004181 [Tetrapyrgos nigripes]|uniref:GP-PDE domain-containing protein n=1 Tax=Tetrapyrgos nigripes TaxID=182062 RepID=A0A8H5GUB3_9AGAR|nr:hypothetical protein D9758_004181 [Tetrapyrgos nigripes]